MKRLIIGLALCAAACLGTPVAAHSDSLRDEVERLNEQLEQDRFERSEQRKWDQFDRAQDQRERDEQRRQDQVDRQFDRAMALCDGVADPGRAAACFKRITVR